MSILPFTVSVLSLGQKGCRVSPTSCTRDLTLKDPREGRGREGSASWGLFVDQARFGVKDVDIIPPLNSGVGSVNTFPPCLDRVGPSCFSHDTTTTTVSRAFPLSSDPSTLSSGRVSRRREWRFTCPSRCVSSWRGLWLGRSPRPDSVSSSYHSVNGVVWGDEDYLPTLRYR